MSKRPILLVVARAYELLKQNRISQSREINMKKTSLFAIAFILVWLSAAQAQVWVEPRVRSDGTYVGGIYRNNPDASRSANRSFPGYVDPSSGRQTTGDSSRYLNNYYKRNDVGNSGHNSNPYSYNPYTIYRR